MKETLSPPPSVSNGVDVSGRFIPNGDPKKTAPHTFAERVAYRAYFLYMDAAAVHGNDVEHWLLAERQLRAQESPRS